MKLAEEATTKLIDFVRDNRPYEIQFNLPVVGVFSAREDNNNTIIWRNNNGKEVDEREIQEALVQNPKAPKALLRFLKRLKRKPIQSYWNAKRELDILIHKFKKLGTEGVPIVVGDDQFIIFYHKENKKWRVKYALLGKEVETKTEIVKFLMEHPYWLWLFAKCV